MWSREKKLFFTEFPFMNLDGANDEKIYDDEKDIEVHVQNILDSTNPLYDLLQSDMDENTVSLKFKNKRNF